MQSGISVPFTFIFIRLPEFSFLHVPVPCAALLHGHKALECFDFISDSSHAYLTSSFVSCKFPKHPFSRDISPSYYNFNYVVWHSPFRLLACLLSSSKHALTGLVQDFRLWQCGSLPLSRSPTQENKSSPQNKTVKLGSDPAGCL